MTGPALGAVAIVARPAALLRSAPGIERPGNGAEGGEHEEFAGHGDILPEMDCLIRAEVEEKRGQQAEAAKRARRPTRLEPSNTSKPPPSSVRITRRSSVAPTPLVLR